MELEKYKLVCILILALTNLENRAVIKEGALSGFWVVKRKFD